MLACSMFCARSGPVRFRGCFRIGGLNSVFVCVIASTSVPLINQSCLDKKKDYYSIESKCVLTSVGNHVARNRLSTCYRACVTMWPVTGVHVAMLAQAFPRLERPEHGAIVYLVLCLLPLRL